MTRTPDPLDELSEETRNLVNDVMETITEAEQDEVGVLAQKILDVRKVVKEKEAELTAKKAELRTSETSKLEILAEDPPGDTTDIDATIADIKNEIGTLTASLLAKKNLYRKYLETARSVYPKYFKKR